MATNSKRDVRLAVEVETTGTESLRALAGDVRGVGTAAGASAPEIDRLTAELTALQAATEAARRAEAAATSEKRAAREAFDANRTALERLRVESTTASRATTEYADAERKLQREIVNAREALRARATATTAASAETRAAVAAERTLAEQLQRVQTEYRQTAAAAAAAAREQTTGNAALAGSLGTLEGQLTALRNVAGLALGGSLVGSLARQIGDTADAYAGLSARIKIATGDGAGFDSTFERVFEVANRTGVAVEDVGALFTKLSQAGRELNLTSTDALQLAEAVSQATQLSGASAQEAAASVTQFAQAIASGKLQGDELRSILENSPRLAKALSDGLGVTIGQLRELGTAGALTAKDVIAALQGQSQALQSEFDRLPPTVGRAIQTLNNEWTRYVGQVDKATGASTTAASAITALAGSLDTLGAVLFSAAKAAAALAAINLARGWLDAAAAARVAATATQVATAATVANTAATIAGEAAQAAQIATVGRFASLLGTIKLLSFVGVVTNLREIGTAAGEGVAKLMGYGKQLEELEARQKADAAAAREAAAATNALAQAKQQATDKALGLTKEARTLVAEFGTLTGKGESAADALGKLSKALNLDDVRGIQTAGAALDALALRGKITAQQITEALAGALKGEDLGRFEAQARAAFDSSEQGARRLAAALDAVADAALTRAGTSARELASGFSAASTSAINDVDALARTLRDIKAPADEAGRALAASLDKATAAASTERALQAVIARVEALGRAGDLSGTLLTDALEKARKKLEDLKPGINSLGEALRAFGLQSRDELKATADKLGEAYLRIAQSGQASIEQLTVAYGKWRTAALQASGGVESGQLQLQRVILENRGAVLTLGPAIESSMDKGRRATDAASTAQERYNQLLRNDPTRLVGGDGIVGIGKEGTIGSDKYTKERNKSFDNTPFKSASPNDVKSGTIGSLYAPPPDNSGDWYWTATASRPGGEWLRTPGGQQNQDKRQAEQMRADAVKSGRPDFFNPVTQRRESVNASPERVQNDIANRAAGTTGMSTVKANQAAAANSGSRTVNVNLNVGGRTVAVQATPDAADALVAALAEAQRRAGGG